MRASILLLCLSPVLAACTPVGEERLILFPTAAHLDKERKHWVVPVEGWVFEPMRGRPLRNWGFKRLIKGIGFEDKEEEEARRIFDSRADTFIADGHGNRFVTVELGGEQHRSPPTDSAGRFAFEVKVPVDEAEDLARWRELKYTASATVEGERRDYSGTTYLIPPAGISVISDIDDTIKISNITVKGEMVRSMFIREFRAVPGMPEAYRRWGEEGAVFHYVSGSPTQLYMALSEFARSERFPDAVFSLKRIGWFDSFMSNLWKSSLETKPPMINRIIEAFPERKFILVGDSGEYDPEVYGDVARKHPDKVLHIYIRDVTGDHVRGPRYAKAFDKLPPDSWTIFTDPVELDPIAALVSRGTVARGESGDDAVK